MYFEWKKMPVERTFPDAHAPVVIVGGGPIGLAMAQALSRHGIRSIVLEKRDQVSDGSRAVVLSRRSMQIFDALGVGTAVLDKAFTWDFNAVHFGDRLIYEMRLPQPGLEKHRTTNLQQCWVEQIFLDRLQADGLVEVRWQSELAGLKQVGDKLELAVTGPDGGDYTLGADYLIAADGARGSIRKMLDLRYEGERFEQRFIITDFEMKSNLERGRRVWFSPPYAPGTTVLQHCGPFDMWRLDFQLHMHDDAEAETKPERVAERLAAHLAMIGETAPYQIIWTSIYRANALSLPTYNKGRVLFVGDAAHQIPIFGGRGINNGYMDVLNLAWKLDYVMRDIAGPGLLDTYTDERRTSILQTLEDLKKVTIYMTTPSPAVALMRDTTLSLALTEPFVHTLFDPFRVPPYASLPIDVTEQARSADRAFEGGPELGRVVPDLPLSSGSNAAGERLLDFCQLTFVCLAWGGSPDADARVRKVFRSIAETGLPVKCLAIGLDETPGSVLAVSCEAAQEHFAAIPGTVYLIRPDHHVAARWRQAEATAVVSEIRHCLRRELVEQATKAVA